MNYLNLHISVVTPVYKAENCIEKLVFEIKKNLSSITSDYEIILVNDASPDNSWEKIEQLCSKDKRIKGINLSKNVGQHAAISAGLKYALGEKIIIMDCDLQDDPDAIAELLKKSREGYDIVMARRIQRKDNLWRQFLSWSFHQVLSLKLGIKTDPAIANYAVYDQNVIKHYRENYGKKAFSVLDFLNNFTLTTIDVVDCASTRKKTGYTFSKLVKLAYSLLFSQKKEQSKPLYIIQKTINIALEKYEVKLTPLTDEKIEMVRQWRNEPVISQYMEYREYITLEMQQQWFKSINNPNNYYFIIEYEGIEIGLINTKNIDYINKTAEGGLFIANEKYLNSDIALRASLCALDFGAEVLCFNVGTIHVLKMNKKAIEFNKMLGYVLAPNQDNIENQLYKIDIENYLHQRKYLTRLLS